MNWCRFQAGQKVSYGVIENGVVTEVTGDPFGSHTRTSTTHMQTQVKLLVPVDRPSKVLALAGAYKSHLGAGDLVTTVTTTTKVTTKPSTGETTSDSKTVVETEKPGEKKEITLAYSVKMPNDLIVPGVD